MRSVLIILLVSLVSCSTSYRYVDHKPSKSLVREKTVGTQKPIIEIDDRKRYHSAYSTGNSYYDARNKILDSDIKGALDLLLENLESLEYQHRAALWIFLCYCKMQELENADQFLKQYVIPLSIDPEDKSAISVILKYYLGLITDEEVITAMKRWDDLDNCAAYYYYGAYKKYYEGDYVSGNEYISKSLRTNISEYSEFKFSEVEVKGFTSRNPGQYIDFPISDPTAEEAGFDLSAIAAINEDRIEDMDIGDIETMLGLSQPVESETFLGNVPQGLTEEQYAVPSAIDDSWEVYNEEQLIEVLEEEALAMTYNRINDDQEFMIETDLPLVLYPDTASIESYMLKYDTYLEDIEFYESEYGLDAPLVTVNLSKGDFITGAIIPCQAYNIIMHQYEDDINIVFTLLFAVQEDRRVELRMQFFRMMPGN